MSKHTQTPARERIGFIGQGFIGKHMADDFAERGFDIVRYALEAPYATNKDRIADCDVVFIAVPTPTTPAGFDASALTAVLPLVGVGKVAVIKSTILPGTTAWLQAQFSDRAVLHSPEFLREKQAALDTREPLRNLIGVPAGAGAAGQQAAQRVLTLLPKAQYARIVSAEEAELIKYGGNGFLALKVVYANLLYDIATAVGADYEVVAEAMGHDPRIGPSHLRVIDSSGHPGAATGRGAGGHCFPKDWAALCELYERACVDDAAGVALLRAVEAKNRSLLTESGKDLDLLAGIYGPE